MIDLSMQRDDFAKDRFTYISSRVVLGHDAWSDLDFGSRFVDVKGADDDEAWVRGEVSDRDGNAFDDVLVDGVDVVFQLGRYGHDGRRLCNSA
jgi:hypothetical protein